jgi:hypothetical protein
MYVPELPAHVRRRLPCPNPQPGELRADGSLHLFVITSFRCAFELTQQIRLY